MVHNTRNYCLFFFTLSIVGYSKNTKEQNVSVQRLKFALSNGPNRVGVSPSHLRTETVPVSETFSLLFLEYWTMDKVKKNK
jgi:hypothetical protein